MPVRTSLGGVGVVVTLGSRDYYGYRDDALALIPLLTTLWTDLHPSDPGVVTLELFSGIADNLSLYEDRQANENFLATCTQRASGLKFARFATYSPRQNTSAVVTLNMTFSGAGALTAGFAMASVATQGQDAVRFELRTTYNVLAPGTVALEFIEGETVEEILGDSDGLADQTFSLTDAPVAYNPDGTSSLQILVDEGAGFILCTEVNDFLDSAAADLHYVVWVDEFDRVEVQFGDGVNGKIPSSGNDNVKSIARIGGGVVGNQVGINLITEILDTSFAFVTSGTNPATPQGGEDKESLDEMKVNIPRWIRQNDREVTEDDYALEAELVGGVASAKAVRGDAVGGSVYEMYVYLRAAGADPVPAGTWNPRTEVGTGLVGQVGTACTAKKEGPTKIVMGSLNKVRPWLTIAVYIHDNFLQTDVITRVERCLSACLNGYEIDTDGKALGVEADIPVQRDGTTLPDGYPRNMGDDLKKSYLNQMLESIDGVDYVEITRLQREPYARKLYDFDSNPTFSEIEVDDVARQTLTVQFTSPTTFTVTSDVLGLQPTTGTLGVAWNGTGALLCTFTITAGVIPNFTGNRYEIKLGPYLDTLSMDEFELLTNYVGGDTVAAVQTLTYSGGIT